MKHIFVALITIIGLTLTSCADSISDIEVTYRHGIERAEQAQTPEELTQITIDVRNELITGAKGIGGDRKLTYEEMHRYRNAQSSFKQAIEHRYYQLTGQRGIWRDAD